MSCPHTRHIPNSYARDAVRDDAASGDGLGKLLKDLGRNVKREIDAGNAERGERLYVSDEPRRDRRASAPYEGRESRKRFGVAPAP